ncbi:hypothetical protein PHJA_000931000 [Phtheirospermum japonicum]|uniref:Uncharacterized protein n=1 Tax=Phtheirospermum japonicum TaxID=374723 RepID=A0A830BV97_9LAMI|nr:hypothetical protein PHJA_000931000 [Phtheirospermum japonicum]
MDDSEKSVSNAEAEIKTSGDDGKENATDEKVGLGRILETGPPSLDSILKPVVEKFAQATEFLEPSCVAQVEKELVEKLVHVSESSSGPLPTSDEKVGESTESAVANEAGLDENPRSTHTQPFAVVAAGSQASWMNCCGLLDVFRPSDQRS